jgi:uncharacterized protein YunC (DUF1805 family)
MRSGGDEKMPLEADAQAVGENKLRLIDAGANGRIVVSDSLSYCDDRVIANDVIVGASFAGAGTIVFPLARGVKAVIAHDAGVGKDQSGINGLPFGDRFGLPVAAVAGMTASLSNGNSLYEGRISHANKLAAELGVRAGQSTQEAAKLLTRAPPGKPVDAFKEIDFTMREVEQTSRGKIFAGWTLIQLTGTFPHDVFALATHSARVAAEHAFRWNVRGWIANDAGMGKNESGIAGLWPCDEKDMPAASVSAMSACIGDGMSTYNDGLISAVNKSGARKGILIGMTAREALERMLG